MRLHHPSTLPFGQGIRTNAFRQDPADARRTWRLWISLAGLLLCLLLSRAGRSQETLLSGAAFERELQAPIEMQWKSNPLRPALRNLSDKRRIAIFLDRRVPPETRVDFTARGRLMETLEKLAEGQGLGASVVENVIYIGPKKTAMRVAGAAELLREQLRSTPAAVRPRIVKSSRLGWPMLATPREILDSLIKPTGLALENPDAVPHDLWPKAQLPSTSWAGRVTLVLAGFHLTARFSDGGRGLQLVAIPDRARVSKVHPLSDASGKAVEKLRKDFPKVTIAPARGQLRVTADLVEHYLIAQRLRTLGAPVAVGPGARKVYDLKIANQPVGGVLKALAAKFMLQPEISPTAVKRLNDRVSFDARKASRDELLTAALRPAGLKFRIQGNKIHVDVMQ